MAEQEQNNQQEHRPETNTQLTKGLIKDVVDYTLPPGAYTHARNATIVLPDGMNNCISTEPANIPDGVVPYTLIGRIPLGGDLFILFSTDDTISEIGQYNEATGVYTTRLNDLLTITTVNPLTGTFYPGMGFKRSNLITGQSRRNFDCGFNIYWADGLNPNRMLDTQYLYPNPWVQNCALVALCIVCSNTALIDINQLRLSPQFTVPCLTLTKSTGPGSLLNGQYQVCIRFAINTIPCTDFLPPSNTASIWAHGNMAGAIVLSISGIDTETMVIYPEIEVVVVSMVNFQVQAKKLGIYSSTTKTIYIDNLDQELVNIDLKLLPLATPIIEKSDALYNVADYLCATGVYYKPEINYQPLANQIQAFWSAHAYPADYYHKGGLNGFPMNVSSQGGERYNFYIRWRYTDGDVSAAYVIPGLPGGTAAQMFPGGPAVGDGSIPIAYGKFAGYSSTEIYPNDQPSVWNANIAGFPQYDLCGEHIRLHEFPDQATFGGTTLSHFNPNGITISGNETIRVFGAFFSNIQAPVDINGALVPNIQGYEILRSVRNGHQHVVACGMVNNMRTVLDNVGNRTSFSNYPYNDLGIDVFLTNSIANINTGTVGNGFNSPLPAWPVDFSQTIVSFHSPDTSFEHPYLGIGTLDMVMTVNGQSTGSFQTPYQHPLFKVLTNFDSWLGNLIGLIELGASVIGAIAAVTGGSPIQSVIASTQSIPFTLPLFFDTSYNNDVAGTDVSSVTKFAQAAANFAIALAFAPIQASVIREQFLTIVKGLIPGRQYAAQYNSAGYYNVPGPIQGRYSIGIEDYSYINNRLQYFAGRTINNLYRNPYLAIQLTNSINPYFGDSGSRFNLGAGTLSLGTNYSKPIGSFYGMYKVPQPSQYGQVDSTKIIPISCIQQVIPGSATSFTSSVIFGGDVYINRYTEKNPFFFFNDWLEGIVPEDQSYDYRNYINVTYPMFWINNDVINYTLLSLASDNRRLDGPVNLFTPSFPWVNFFYVNTGYFYLFCNGIRDFYVESMVNVGYRDWEDQESKMFYNPYGPTQDIGLLFRSDIIKSDILYKYDYSLSASKFYNQYLSWSHMLERDYSPVLAYTCDNYYPRRLAYSLPQEEELKKDNWKVFLPNNYKDFPSAVTAIKNINKTGAIILLKDESPQSIMGIESIQTRSGTDFTTGTGELFKQYLQSVSNTDDGYQYGSCKSRLSVLSTPYGIFWASQDTGKIFQYAPGKAYYNEGETMTDITTKGLKYWMSLYLPSQLLKQFPDYPLADNPVAGVGLQLIYDPTNELLYICKKDYQAKPGVSLTGSTFHIGPFKPPVTVTLGDPAYFIDCSWTISYDPKQKKWVSFHDWHPSLNIQGRTHFLTTHALDGTLWRHNQVTNLFANYYGTDYPFEVEYPVVTGANVTTLESIEYYMESYLYQTNQTDKYQQYNNGFDYALLYNSEQATLPLFMVLKPWNRPYATLGFPITSAAGANIYYTKQEQKYRIGMMLKDMTNDRGEFGVATVQLFQTDPNGYTWNLNPAYYDFSKSVFAQKKIRHFKSRIFLRKMIVGNSSMSLYFSSTKNINSPR